MEYVMRYEGDCGEPWAYDVDNKPISDTDYEPY